MSPQGTDGKSANEEKSSPIPRSHALLVGREEVGTELRGILKGYGYIVEQCRSTLEATRLYRQKKQALVIVDADALRGFPERLFRFFRLVNPQAVVLVASASGQSGASRYLLWGAHDVIHLPLQREALNFTLSRTSAYHRRLVRSIFLRNLFWFGVAMLPLWLLALYLLLVN